MGDVVVLGGTSVAKRSWFEVRPPDADWGLDTPLLGPVAVEIRTATYSNTPYPGVGVPFYS